MRRFTTGIETGDLTIWDSVVAADGTATCAASTVNPRSGTYSMRVQRTDNTPDEVGVGTNYGGQISQHNDGTTYGAFIEASSTTNEMWVRCYMRFTTLSGVNLSTQLDLIYFSDDAITTTVASLQMQGAGSRLRFVDPAGTVTSIFTPSTGVYYKVMIHLKKTASNAGDWDVSFYNEDTRATNAANGSWTGFGTTDVGWVFFGLFPATGKGAGAVDFHFDDIAINCNRGNIAKHATEPRPGRVVQVIVPTGEGGTIDFLPSTGTDNALTIDEYPAGAIDTADYNINPTGTTAVKDLLTVANYAGTANGVVQAVQVYCYVADGIGSDGLGFIGGLQDSGANVQVPVEPWPGSGGASDPETLNGVCIGGTGATVDTVWTNTEFDATQIMYKRDAVPATELKRVFAAFGEVEDQVPITSLPHNPPLTRSTLIRR